MTMTRLTTGNKPLHVRREHFANVMKEYTHALQTMLDNWPEEWEFPEDHDIHELIRVSDVIADEMVKPDEQMETN